MSSGFNFFANAINVTPVITEAWTDVDVSAHIPVGATGVILNLDNTFPGAQKVDVRKKGSGDDDYDEGIIAIYCHRYAIVGVDANRKFEAKIFSTRIVVWLVGYTDEHVTLFTDKKDYSIPLLPPWQDTDVSADVSAEAVGVIVKMINTSPIDGLKGGVRKKGSTDNWYMQMKMYGHSIVWLSCGVNAAKVFQQYIDSALVDLYLVGYVELPVVYFTNAKAYDTFFPADVGVWKDIDVTGDTEAACDGVLLELLQDDVAIKRLQVRKKGSTDERWDRAYLLSQHRTGAYVGVNTDNIFQVKIESYYTKLRMVGYCKPYVPPPPAPPAKPLISKPLVNPTLINAPCVR